MQKQIKIKERKIIITKQFVSNCLMNEQTNQYSIQVYNRYILYAQQFILFYSISCAKLLRNLPIEQSILPDNYYLKDIIISKKFDSNKIMLYDLSTGLLFRTIMKKDLQILCLTIDSQQNLLALSDLKGKISILNFKNGVQIASYNQKIQSPNYLKFNHSQTILYSYSQQSAQGFDIIKKQIVWQIELNSKISQISINSSGKYCLTTQNCIDPIKQESYFQLQNLETQDIQGYFCNIGIIKEFSISNDEKFILIVSDYIIQVYDKILCQLIIQLKFQDAIFRAAFCHTNEQILVSKENFEIQFYNFQGECIYTIKGIENLWVDIYQKKYITFFKGQCRIYF